MAEDLRPDHVDGPDLRARMHEAITAAVRHQGSRLRNVAPTAMVAGLVAAALMPILLPLASAGAVGIAASGLVGLLGSTGSGYISDFLKDTISRIRGTEPSGGTQAPQDLQERLERELLRHLESRSEGSLALRRDMSRLLIAVDGIEAALEGAAGDLKAVLAQNFADLGMSFSEFRWMLGQIQSTLMDVGATQAEALTLQRQQLDFQREQLTKTNLLLYRFSAAPEATVGPRDNLTPTAVALRHPDSDPAQAFCPYKGLSAFQPEDAKYFFGRSELVAGIAARLAETSFLALIGASGSGKSSLIGAGILPLIWRGALPGSGTWTVVRLSPGAHPLDELAVRLSAVFGTSASSLLRELESDERALALALRQASAAKTLDDRVVLVVDQFEELFTLCRDAQQRARFIGVILRTALRYDSDRVLVLIALRADFYAECAAYPQLSSALQDNHVLVAAMGKDDLVQAIVEPARSQHLTVEPGLVDTILQDVGDEPGALPLLSHALRETWVRREGQLLTLRSYADSGGVRKAIATTAEGVYATLTAEEKQVAKNLLLRLAEVGEVTYSRRRVHRSELASDGSERPLLAAVLSKFVDARLIIVSEDSVEVAHEALIREWPRLRGWLSEEREDLLLHRHLTEAAEGWAALQRDPGELYRGARLAAVAEWAETHHDRLNELEREFLHTSQAVQRSELEAVRRRNRQLGGLALALSVLVVATILAAGAAQTQRLKADEQARLALSSQYVAEADLNRFRDMSYALLRNLLALRIADTPETRRSLILTIESHPQVTAILPGAGTERSIGFSPDGHTLAFAGGDRSVRFWDLRTHRQVGAPLHGHTDVVVYLAFSPDGKLLASGGADGTIRLWDTRERRQLGAPLDARAKGVYSLAFSPDSKLIASGYQDGTVRLWNLRTSRQIGRIIADRQGAVRNLSFSSDGRVIASTGDDTGVHLWELDRSLQQARAFLNGASFLSPEMQVRSIAFLPRRRALAVGYQDGKIRLWDIDARRQLGKPFLGHTDAVADLAISVDGSTILSGSADSTIRVWSIRDHRQRGPSLTAHTGGMVGVALNRDGRTAVSSGQDGTVVVWDMAQTIAAGTSLKGHKGYVHDVAFDGSGRLLASAGQDGTVRLWNAREGRQAGSPLVGHRGRVNTMAFAPDGKTVASGGFDGTVRFWDAERNAERGAPISAGGGVITGVVFSPDGRSIAIGSVNGGLRLWDVRSRQPLGAPLIEGSVTATAMSADGKLLASSDGQRLIRTWDVATRREVGPPLYARNVRSLAISPDGRILAAGTYEGPIYTWDIPSRRPKGLLQGHGGAVWGLDFDPGSRLLASSSSDNSVRLWDLASFRNSAILRGPGGFSRVAFSPDGKSVGAAGWGGMVRIWPTDIGSWKQAACAAFGAYLKDSPLVLPEDRTLC